LNEGLEVLVSQVLNKVLENLGDLALGKVSQECAQGRPERDSDRPGEVLRDLGSGCHQPT
jgi:hypothetical protein